MNLNGKHEKNISLIILDITRVSLMSGTPLKRCCTKPIHSSGAIITTLFCKERE